MNPDEFDIEMKKMVGLWPDPNLVSRSIIPYAKRLKTGKNLSITLLDDLRGENTVDFLENIENIKRINVINEYHSDNSPLEDIFRKNVGKNDKVKKWSVDDDDIDAVS